MKIILVGNYKPDRQQSMLRFASVLYDQYRARNLDVELIHPEPVAARGLDTRRGLGKWLGYIDKFVLFPRRLAARARASVGKPVIVHVCDHSNASYTRPLRCCRHLVTCNDLLAIRSALGEFPENPTSWTGKRLQRMILGGLNGARRVACISEATRQDILRLTRLPAGRVELVYMGLNYDYHPMNPSEYEPVLRRLLGRDSGGPDLREGVIPAFVVHVGGNQWYKNRMGLLRLYTALWRAQPDCPELALVGEPVSEEMTGYIRSQGLGAKVRLLEKVGNEEVRALYSAARCLIFPSLAEGFGWPIVEAQACGCPVVTSGRAPMTEVGGGSAVYIDPERPEQAAEAVARLVGESSEQRSARVRSGYENANRFSTGRMIDQYLQIYEAMLAETI